MVNSGCYNFKMKCGRQDVCKQDRTSARPILNAKRDGKVSNDRFTLRKAMGFSYLNCKKDCKDPAADPSYCVDKNILLKYRRVTPFRVKEGLVPVPAGNKRQSMGNNKFVYDSSDYMKFKRLSAKNKNYGDCSFGGDDSKAAQSVIRRRR